MRGQAKFLEPEMARGVKIIVVWHKAGIEKETLEHGPQSGLLVAILDQGMLSGELKGCLRGAAMGRAIQFSPTDGILQVHTKVVCFNPDLCLEWCVVIHKGTFYDENMSKENGAGEASRRNASLCKMLGVSPLTARSSGSQAQEM